MTLWLLLALTFVVQEPISSSVILLSAYQAHYNVWLIHLLFTAATIFDIVVTYYLGQVIRKKFSNRRWVIGLKKKIDQFSAFIGEKGKVVALIVYAPLIFPISGLFIPWLDISLTEAIIYILIGEWIFWYAYEWLLVLGVKTFVSGSYSAVAAILVISGAIALGTKFLMQKKKSPQQTS